MGLEVGSVAPLEPVLDAIPAPVVLVEPGSGRVLYANPAAHRLAGGRFPLINGADDYADRPLRCAEDGHPLSPDEHPGLRAARGERFRNVALDWDLPGGRRSIVVSGDSLALEGGGQVALLSFEDVTELQAARRRAALLADAGPLLVGSLDPEELARRVAQLVVPAVADWCFVELLRPDGSIDRAAIAHADPSKQPLVEEYDARYPLDPDAPVGSARVIRTGEPEILEELTEEMLQAVAVDERQIELLREAGFRSSVVVPLRAHGRVIGDLVLANAQSARRYGPDDLAFAQELADRCALALDNARLYTELRDAEAAARRAGEEVNTILGGVADAVTAQAPDGRLIYANDAAVRIVGYSSVDELVAAPPGEVLARFEMLDERGQPLNMEDLPGRQALLGRWPEPMIVRSRAAGTAEYRWTRVKATPVYDDAGNLRLAINVVEDITELKRTEQGERFLAEAGRVLASSLDHEQTLATVAQLAVPDIADWCTVDVLADGIVRRLAVAHADPEKVALAHEIARRYPDDPEGSEGVARVLRTGEPELYAEITDEMLEYAARDEEHLELLRSIGMSSVMLVPMTLRGSVMGIISFVSAEAGRPYTAADVELAESLASRAATAIENARLYEARSAIARTLQASLLPPTLPEVPGFTLAAIYQAAGDDFEVGGDFYDVFSTADDQWYAVIGDVCGKGAEAAAVTAMARYTIRAAAVRRRSPAAILRLLSEAMLRQEESGTAGRFCTIACLHLDLSHTPARVTVACGGHPLPAVLRADGSVEELGAPGTLLGLVDRPDLQDRSGELRPGDTVVLYTDGLTEAGAPDHVWAPQDLATVLRGAAGKSAQGVIDHAVAEALAQIPLPRDDIAVLGLQAQDVT